MLDPGMRDDLLQRRREVLEDDDGFGAGVLELMLEFAGGVERVDVNRDEASAQHGGDRHRILQHVRHHDRHARAALQSAPLQPRSQRSRQGVDVTEGQSLVHADIGPLVAMLGEALLEQRHDAGIGRRIDVRRHAGRIALEPEAVHVVPPRTCWTHYSVGSKALAHEKGPSLRTGLRSKSVGRVRPQPW